MTHTQAALIRHIIQHKSRALYDAETDEYTVILRDLDPEMYEAWQQFENDICCHVLERLVVPQREE